MGDKTKDQTTTDLPLDKWERRLNRRGQMRWFFNDKVVSLQEWLASRREKPGWFRGARTRNWRRYASAAA